MTKDDLKYIGEKLTDTLIKNNLITNKYIYVYVEEARKFAVLYEKQSNTTWYVLTLGRHVFRGSYPKWSIKRLKFIEKLLNEKIDDKCKNICKDIFDDELYLTEEQLKRLYVILNML